MFRAGEGRYAVALAYHKIGKDRLVLITGGEEEHIGSITLIEEKDRLQTISKKGHKDHIVSEKMAKMIYDKIEDDLVVICGIHVDDASKEEIESLVRNAQECVEQFLLTQE